jgi:hypothetical protein
LLKRDEGNFWPKRMMEKVEREKNKLGYGENENIKKPKK